MYIGVVANLIIFPVNLLIVTLFRKSRPRKVASSRLQKAINAQVPTKGIWSIFMYQLFHDTTVSMFLLSELGQFSEICK